MSLPPDDPRAWTRFDPNLRIDVYPGEAHTNTVVIIHLPTGMQEAEGATISVPINQAKAMARLKRRAQWAG
jgi:hypothetical protein